MEFKRVERELQHMEAKFMAWQYIQAGKMVARAAEQLQEKELEIQEITDKIEHNRKKAEAVDKEIEEIQQRDSVSYLVKLWYTVNQL